MSDPATSPPSSRAHRRLPPALLAILGLQLAWGAWYVAQTSFELEGLRHFVLFDDATISMAYARNAAAGHGLVWSPEEEPVEGFTNPLWTGVMAAMHWALPLPPRLMALPVQILSLVLLLVHTALVYHVARRFLTPEHPRAALAAAGCSAFYVPLTYWSLLGMETALQAVWVTAAVGTAWAIVRDDRDRWLALGGLLALGYLTRMDMLVPAAAILGWIFVVKGPGRLSLRRAVLAAGLLGAAVLGYQAFRLLYFGDPLPNTYYLKLTGIPWAVRGLQGLATFGDFVRAHALALVPILGGTVAWLRRRRELQLPALLFAAGAAYSVYVGGDAWEPRFFPDGGGIRANRFLAYLMPQVFLLGSGVLAATLGWAARRGARVRRLAAAGLSGATVLVFLSANGLLPGSGFARSWQDALVTRPPLMTPEHRAILEDWKNLRHVAPPGASVAVFWAGIPAYFNPGYELVDIAGYTDREGARRPVFPPLDVSTFDRYRPGHAKLGYPRLLTEIRPDVVFQTYPLDPEFAVRLLTEAGYVRRSGYWVREGSAAAAEAHREEPHAGL